jgi:hypothetical protein
LEWEKNIDTTKTDGSFSEGEMEHIDDEFDEEKEDLTNEKHLAKKHKTVAIKTTKKGKGVDGPSPLRKGKMKKKLVVERMNIITNTRHATEKIVSQGS